MSLLRSMLLVRSLFTALCLLCMVMITAGLTSGCAKKPLPAEFSARPGNTAMIASGDGHELTVAVSHEFPLVEEFPVEPGSIPEYKNIRADKALVYKKSEQAAVLLLDIETRKELRFQIKPKFPETGTGWIDGMDYDYYVTNQNCLLQYAMYYPVKHNEYLAVSYVEPAPASAGTSNGCPEWDLRAELTDEQQAHIRQFKRRAHNAVRVFRAP